MQIYLNFHAMDGAQDITTIDSKYSDILILRCSLQTYVIPINSFCCAKIFKTIHIWGSRDF